MGSIFWESEQMGFGSVFGCPQWDHVAAVPPSAQRRGKDQELSSRIVSHSHALEELLLGMKPSFLVKESAGTHMRQVFLSGAAGTDPMILLRQGDESVLIGSGCGEVKTRCGNFQTLPDLRLPFSERHRLKGWILLDSHIDVSLALVMLEALEFPPIFASCDIIAKFRNNIHHPEILHRCRFFEIFSDMASLQSIGGLHFIIAKNGDNKMLALRTEEAVIGYDWIDMRHHRSIASADIVIAKDGNNWKVWNDAYEAGEILECTQQGMMRSAFRFVLDTFVMDGNSFGTLTWHTLRDRNILSEAWMLVFTLEEDVRARTISGRIFIDSRGFVHAHEMARIHKSLTRAIRIIYERAREENPLMVRAELVNVLRREVAQYCAALTGRAPLVLPIIIEKSIL